MDANVFIVVLAGLVHATLQLGIGAMLLLYHASLGKHIKKKTRELVSSYILGNAVLIGLAVAGAAYIIYVIWNGEMSAAMLSILVGILVALAIAAWAFYYRLGKSTELWLPKSVSKFINKRANLTESKVEGFGLGMLACFAEMPFALVLIVVAANSIIALPQAAQILMVAIYIIISIAPMIVLRICVKKGNTIVDIQKWRISNKNFIKIVSGAGFLVLAIFILAFKVFGN